jgi:hypothetical protein
MKKKLKEFALVAEIISALAVVAGLIFVGLEIRQSSEETTLNTRAIETAAYQDLISQIIDINMSILSVEKLRDVYFLAQTEELTDQEDINIFGNYAISVARHADLACFQYQQGLIDEERLVATLAIFINIIWTNSNGRDRIAPVLTSTPGLEDCIARVLPYFE